MKRVLFILAFLLLSAAAVCATNTISNPLPGRAYNLGDEIVITGQLMLNETLPSARVAFSARSTSLNKSAEITTKFYSFERGVPASFSQINEGVLSWQVDSVNSSKDWQMVVEIYDGHDDLVRRITSNKFEITDKLSATYSLNKRLFNSGETLNFATTVLDAGGFPVTGTASIYLKERSFGTVETEKVDIVNGYVSYSYTFKSSDPEGKYFVQAEMKDGKGNSDRVVTENLSLTKELQVTCTVGSSEINPGDEQPLYGNLKDAHDNILKDVPVTALITGPSGNKTLKYTADTDGNGNYGFDVKLPKYAEPGIYSVDVSAEDESGNEGFCEESFVVSSTRDLYATLSLNNSWSYPDVEVPLNLRVENKGNVPLSGEVKYFLDSESVVSGEFKVEKGSKTTVEESWEVSGDPGNHSLKAVLYIDDKLMTETQPIKFSIVERPEEATDDGLNRIAAFLFFIVLVAAVFYWKRKDIKEYFWHRDLRKKVSS